MLEFRTHITRADVQAEPQTLFVFGDNLISLGKGGQAKEMRGEPNAIGIPTKNWPRMVPEAFFTDDDLGRWRNATAPGWRVLQKHLVNGGKVVWPAAGIGTGMARLEENAPLIAAEIERELGRLEHISG